MIRPYKQNEIDINWHPRQQFVGIKSRIIECIFQRDEPRSPGFRYARFVITRLTRTDERRLPLSFPLPPANR